MGKQYVMGIDFGTDSVRAVIVDVADGAIAGQAAASYPRWAEKRFCDPDTGQFRQHPLDFLEALTECVRNAGEKAGASVRRQIVAVGFDATASTPAPVSKEGTPLALLDAFATDPDAMFFLWKDHTSAREAREITKVFSSARGRNYCKFQGPYQSEWFWAKILACARKRKDIQKMAWTWIELADWIPSLLAGRSKPGMYYRDIGTAGHKAYYSTEFGGLPDSQCLSRLDPYLAHIAETFESPRPATDVVGAITPEWAKRLGLPAGTLIAGSAIDAHSGGVGTGIRPGTLVKILGTSAVDLFVADKYSMKGRSIDSQVCGMAEDSILPGYWGLETGQAAFGDIFSWLRQLIMEPVSQLLLKADMEDRQRQLIIDGLRKNLLLFLDDQSLGPGAKPTDLITLDWFNGRRYPGLNESLKGGILGLGLGTSIPDLYRSLALSVLFGAYRIYQGYIDADFAIERIVAIGGVAQKSPYLMQMMSDVFGVPIQVSLSTQSCALGAAMFASVAGGCHPSLLEAQQAMCVGKMIRYTPDPAQTARYRAKYQKYLTFGSWYEKQLDLWREEGSP